MRSKKAIKNIVSSLALQIITLICGFAIPKLIMQNYGSEVNGLIASITQFLTYITLADAGLGQVLKAILYKPIAKKDKQTIEDILAAAQRFYNVIVGIFIIYIIILCVIFPMIVNSNYNMLYTSSLIIILSFSSLAEYYFGMIYRVYLMAEQKTYITSRIQIVTTILNAGISILLIYLGFNIQVVKLLSALIFVLRPIMQNIYVKKKYGINIKNGNPKYTLTQKWDGLSQHIASVVHNNTDVAILSIFSNLLEVSVYSVYLLVINGIKRVIEAFTNGIDAAFGDMIARNETENLRNKFKLYEIIYFSIIIVIFSTTFVMIVPFVSVYTKSIEDVNYIRPMFAFFMVLAELCHSIRQPYNLLIMAAGKFKETRRGAWVEAILNIIISMIFVHKFGIIGVAIGTLVAMIVRTLEFVYYSNIKILKIDIKDSIMKILVTFIEAFTIIIVSSWIKINVISYVDWIIKAILVVCISLVVVLLFNIFIYNKEIMEKINKRKGG